MSNTRSNPSRRRSASKGNGPRLHYPNDPQYLWLLLTELVRRKYYIDRPTEYHIKHRNINFFWTTGAITTDDGIRHPENGQFAFVALIEKLYPKARPGVDPHAVFPKPEALILELCLDDKLDKGDEETDQTDEIKLPW